MALIVQKYGGTSVADVERIRHVARRVLTTQKAGHEVVVVVSAMAGETNRLIAMAHALADEPDSREYDMLVSSGEQVTIALLSLAIYAQGGTARSFLGHQAGIYTNNSYARARIREIDDARIREVLKQGCVVVVAGFQGMDAAGNITTLGRGGSDTTAVALAAALKADLCEIYTDVEGVFTADPRLCREARKIDRISHEEMLEMSSQGAKVLQLRSVELAAKFSVPLVVRSSFTEAEGTWVVKEEPTMEEVIVSGVTLNLDEAKVAVRGVPDRPGIAGQIFSPIAASGINVDMIIQNLSAEGCTDITFTVPKADLHKAVRIIKSIATQIGAKHIEADQEIAKVSIIGLGMRSHAGVAAKAFAALGAHGINMHMIATSEIKISIVVDAPAAAKTVNVLHSAFALDQKP